MANGSLLISDGNLPKEYGVAQRTLLGYRPNGYVSFRYDLTPYLNYGTESNIWRSKSITQNSPIHAGISGLTSIGMYG